MILVKMIPENDPVEYNPEKTILGKMILKNDSEK